VEYVAVERVLLVACQNIIAFRKPIVQASLVECCSNHITTRISIQTAGLAFGGTGLCSYRVKGVDGSCAKHLTVESLRSFMLLTVILIIIIPSPMHSLFHSRLKTFLFCKSFPLQPFLFFFRTDYIGLHDFPDFYCYF